MALAWAVTGVAAVGGSVLGHYAGPAAIFIGGGLGGFVGVVVSVVAAAKFGWIADSQRKRAIIGGLIGFIIAAPIAVLNLRTPVVPIAICALVGVGVLLGAGAGTRGLSRRA